MRLPKVEKIKVDRRIKPLPLSKRRIPELTVGEKYYVSFGNNNAILYKLDEIYFEGETRRVSVSNARGSHSLYDDELGTTPEQSVENEVTW